MVASLSGIDIDPDEAQGMRFGVIDSTCIFLLPLASRPANSCNNSSPSTAQVRDSMLIIASQLRLKGIGDKSDNSRTDNQSTGSLRDSMEMERHFVCLETKFSKAAFFKAGSGTHAITARETRRGPARYCTSTATLCTNLSDEH